MIKRVVLACAATALIAGCSEPAPKPSVKDFMKDKVQPTAEIYWGSWGQISDESGITDLTPTTDEGWQKAVDAAKQLGEYGELMKTPDYAEGRGEAWIRFSQGLIDISKRAEQAAANHDGDAVGEIGGLVYDVCTACHQAFPQAEGEEAETAS